jgi:hypothetical protein
MTLDVSATEVAAPLVALAGILLYLRLGRRRYGADADFWEVIRRTLLPQLNRLARRNGWGYAAYELSEAEFVGNVPASPEVFEKSIEGHGLLRMPLAAFKYAPDGRPEVGSWAWRSSLLARLQLHIIIFEAEDGTTDVYGHIEFNAYNPATALLHYTGAKYIPLGETGRSVNYILRHIREVTNEQR